MINDEEISYFKLLYDIGVFLIENYNLYYSIN